ncbi:MAG: hypothetical protein RLY14_2836, partial [Planctomycetota bacterium]
MTKDYTQSLWGTLQVVVFEQLLQE